MNRGGSGGRVLSAPFPWFGGKSEIASKVWRYFGKVRNYVEPFCGTMAVLLGRPMPFGGTETVNDADGMLCNFWRALQNDPDGVTGHADWPVMECDLHARHSWLVSRKEDVVARLEGDPDWFDAKAAGWWVWGICCWIGSGWCAGDGPWRQVQCEDGVVRLVRVSREEVEDGEAGISRKLPRLGDAGAGVIRPEQKTQGVARNLPHLGSGRGVNRKLPHLGNAGVGVNRTACKVPGVSGDLIHLGDAGVGINNTKHRAGLLRYMRSLAERIRRVRVCCGDWTRICGGRNGDNLRMFFAGGGDRCAVFLDPPYASERTPDVYRTDSADVAHDVRAWCLEHGDDKRLRIILCGYGEEHSELERRGWECVRWKARGGYCNVSEGDSDSKLNPARERLWVSPHCAKKSIPRL